jgi:hypothetical protein
LSLPQAVLVTLSKDSLESYPKVLSMGNSVQELRYSFQPPKGLLRIIQELT